MELGLIFHWGPYAVPAYDDVSSARRRRTLNGSEWYRKRLESKQKGFRVVSGCAATQALHATRFPGKNYEHFGALFDAASAEADFQPWMKLAVELKSQYVILTAKHHDGFCLWPTKTTKFCSTRDLLGGFIKAARAHKLRVGLYFSWMEFSEPCTKLYLSKVQDQLAELSKYEVDLYWFDGDWECTSQYARRLMRSTAAALIARGIQVNDRIGLTREQQQNANYLTDVSFRNYHDRELPKITPLVPWEHINTVGLSWGRNKQQEDKDYKSGEALQALHTTVKLLRGRLLLNLGPDVDGQLDPREVRSLVRFGHLRASKDSQKNFECRA